MDKTTLQRTLAAASRGDRQAAADLLPLVYDQLRSLARARMAHLPPGNTLQPTALVHEAYVRTVGQGDPGWDNKGHFFAAASQAMRQIVVDRARRKYAQKRGGGEPHVDVDTIDIAVDIDDDQIVALDDALQVLEREDPKRADLVKLRYFVGLSRNELAEAAGVSVRTIDREWRYVMARLQQLMTDE